MAKSMWHERKIPRDKLLLAQRVLIGGLRCRGFTFQQIGTGIGVSDYATRRWYYRESLARPLAYERLVQMATAPSATEPRPRRTERNPNSISQQVWQGILAECDLWPLLRRSITLNCVMKRLETGPDEFAEMIGVSPRLLNLYLQKRYSLMEAPVVYQVLKLSWTVQGAPKSQSYEERFHQAARRLFGDYYEKGFSTEDPYRHLAISKIAELTGLNESVVVSCLPPYSDQTRAFSLVTNLFEEASRQLAEIG